MDVHLILAYWIDLTLFLHSHFSFYLNFNLKLKNYLLIFPWYSRTCIPITSSHTSKHLPSTCSTFNVIFIRFLSRLLKLSFSRCILPMIMMMVIISSTTSPEILLAISKILFKWEQCLGFPALFYNNIEFKRFLSKQQWL